MIRHRHATIATKTELDVNANSTATAPVNCCGHQNPPPALKSAVVCKECVLATSRGIPYKSLEATFAQQKRTRGKRDKENVKPIKEIIEFSLCADHVPACAALCVLTVCSRVETR